MCLRIYLVVLTQPVVPLVGNDDTGLLRVNSGIREVGGVSQSASSDGLEQRRFTNVRETNLSSFMSKTITEEEAAQLTIPLLRLLPGLPSMIFFSSWAFLGGIVGDFELETGRKLGKARKATKNRVAKSGR